MGRPTKLTPELRADVVGLIEAGNYFSTACDLVGIGERTGHEWLARGEGTSARPALPEYVQFAQEIARANARAEVVAVDLLTKMAGSGNDRAVGYFLERRFPARWGNRAKVDLGGEVGVRPLPAIVELERPKLEAIAGGKAKRKRTA